jgi:FtsZ-binding cell division protein ZapB
LERARDELQVQKKIVENAADTIRSLQAQVVHLKSEVQTSKEAHSSREVQYLTQQREELQLKLDDLLVQQSHWQDQQEQWREKDKQRRVRRQCTTAKR